MNTTSKRLPSIDIVRGLVMLIMVLDHTRDLLHVEALARDPTDLATTSVPLFLTRWVTHLCAPSFVFLAGVSVYLSSHSAHNPASNARFLVSRGLWLILLEFTVVNFGLWFDIHFHLFLFQVIGAIGFGLVVLGLCSRMAPSTLGLIGAIIVAAHQLVVLVPLDNYPLLKAVLTPFFQPGLIPLGPNTTLFMGYPPIPWLGILWLGYGVGSIFKTADYPDKLFRWGLYALGLFLILRTFNIYGDPSPWGPQKDAVFSVLSFLNVSKYPPSLLFVLLMLGISSLLLSWSTRQQNQITAILQMYGKVPLFFYLIHWYLLRLIMWIVFYVQGFTWSDLNFDAFGFGRPRAGGGVSLAQVYLVWGLVLILLYPLCLTFGRYKAAHPEKKWLKFL